MFVALWLISPAHSAAIVASALWQGSLGTSSAFFSGTLVRAVPLTFIGVGLCIAFRAGVFNIGGEGQLLIGAVAATVVGLATHWGPCMPCWPSLPARWAVRCGPASQQC